MQLIKFCFFLHLDSIQMEMNWFLEYIPQMVTKCVISKAATPNLSTSAAQH